MRRVLELVHLHVLSLRWGNHLLKRWEDILWRTQIVTLDRANVERDLVLFILFTLAVQESVALQWNWEALVVDHHRLGHLIHVEVRIVKDGALSLVHLVRIETFLNGLSRHDRGRVLIESILDHLRSLLFHGLWIFSLLLVDGSNPAFLKVTIHSVG